MELHKVADAAQRNLINDAILALARFGEADGRMIKVAQLPLTFQAIMNVVMDLYRVTSGIKTSDIRLFNNTLRTLRRTPLKIDVSTGVNHMCYPKPNGGNRILPSIYNQLRKWWMRANGVCQEPHEMNDGHLDNTLTLLRESHGNVIARSTELLGKMANHFRNQPDIVAKLEALCLEMQKVDVDDMYPVFTILAKELNTRQSIPIVSGVNLDWLNDGSLEWDNK